MCISQNKSIFIVVKMFPHNMLMLWLNVFLFFLDNNESSVFGSACLQDPFTGAFGIFIGFVHSCVSVI